jgi:hypothetical protein
VKTVDPLGRIPVFRGYLQMVGYMDAPDHQDLAILSNFTLYFGDQEAFTGRNLTRFQRAAKGSGQSAAGGSYQIIKGGGVWFVNRRINPIMGGDF